MPLYKALVRNHLDYAASICHRKCATKQLPGMKDIPYQERLEGLKLPTLTYRRTRGDMIVVYKLHQGYDTVKLHKHSEKNNES